MSAKKAAKKSAKKAAKKSHGHHGKHHEGQELRKTYEHLGRLTALEPSLPVAVVEALKKLTELAQITVHAGEQKSAADLLRAGEHLAFGTLASTAKATGLGEDLEAAINAEYEHLVDKADEHWSKHEDERPEGIEELYESMAVAGQAAFHKGAYRRALEFVRGAEALAHVRGGGGVMLEDGGTKAKTLKG
jgi:hypothetical protein